MFKLKNINLLVLIVYIMLDKCHSSNNTISNHGNLKFNINKDAVIRSCLTKIYFIFEKFDVDYKSFNKQLSNKLHINENNSNFNCRKIQKNSKSWLSYCLNKCCNYNKCRSKYQMTFFIIIILVT
jgi:hypothetical protein